MYDLFPNDVRIEVLRRLPFSSLMRFRSINKSWRHIIDSPSFRKLHVENQLSSDSHDDDPALLKFYYNVKKLEENRLFNLSLASAVVSHNVHGFQDFKELSIMAKSYNIFPSYQDFVNNNAATKFSLPVHGLICLYKEDSTNPIALCNPSLGEIKILPASSPSLSRDMRVVGLGYDDLERDYKIVQFWNEIALPYSVVEVYSRKRNTWTALTVHKSYYVTNPIPHLETSSSAVVAHWKGVVFEGDRTFYDAIVSFDMRSEVLKLLRLPCLMDSEVNRIYAKENSSFVMFATPDYRNLEIIIWEYEREWIIVGKVGRLFDRRVWPVATWKSNGFMLKLFSQNKKLLVLHNNFSQEIIKSFEYRGNDFIVDFVEYRGSFISP